MTALCSTRLFLAYGPRPGILWTTSSGVDEGRQGQLAVQQGLDGSPILAQRLSLALRMDSLILEVLHWKGASAETCTQLTGRLCLLPH